MKYLLMMHAPGKSAYQISSWPHQDIVAHIAFMKGFVKKLADAGELASGRRPRRTRSSEARARRAATASRSRTACSLKRRSSWPATGSSRSTASRAPTRSRRKLRPRRGRGRRAAQHGDRSAASDERAAQGIRVTHAPLEPGIQHLLRDLAPQVLGIMVRRFRDFSAAEDAVQEALIAAATQWPREGRPESPRAWLIRVACPAHARITCGPRARDDSARRSSSAWCRPSSWSHPPPRRSAAAERGRHARSPFHVLSPRAVVARRPSPSRCARSAG